MHVAYCYRQSSVVCLSVCHDHEPCKNCWTDRDAVWCMDSGGPKEPYIRLGVQIPIGRGKFEGGKRRPIVKYRDSLPWSVQKRMNWLRCCLRYGLGWLEETCIRRGSRPPHMKGQFWGREWPRTCLDISSDWYSQSDSAGGRANTVQMAILVY